MDDKCYNCHIIDRAKTAYCPNCEKIKKTSQDAPTVDVLDKIRAEIEQKIEQERFARSIFRGEEKDAIKAEQCTGSIFAYNNVIKLIDKYKTESEV